MFSFAIPQDLISRGVEVEDEDVASQLLSDASTHLRSIVGESVFPRRTSTFSVWIGPGRQWIDVPLPPVLSIDAVQVQGVDVEVVRQGVSVQVCGPGKVDITATHGYPEPPAELVSWTCVLASQMLAVLDELGTIGSGEVSSIGIDDYRKNYSQAVDRGAFALPQHISERLASQYGSGAFVTGSLS